jgi:hypothetical protein
MKQIKILLIIIMLILVSACSSQQQIVYRDCNCNTNWNTFGWGNSYFFNPYWEGRYSLFWNDWRYNPYLIYPYRLVQPKVNTPSRYDRRVRVGERPNRVVTPSNRNDGRYFDDNMYPNRNTPVERSVTPPNRSRIGVQSDVENGGTSVYRNTTPPSRSRIQTNQNTQHRVPMTAPSRYSTPTNSTPSRVGSGGRDNE